MRPVIAIVGRPNVGKSTLYNRLTRSRDALVDDQPGVTRDRLIGVGRVGEQYFWVIDTGGITAEDDALQRLLREQIDLALAEADAIIFMVDGRDGPNATDREIAVYLRVQQTPLYVVVNKTEGIDGDLAISEFFDLGLGKPYAVSARTGTGVRRLIDAILDQIPGTGSDEVLPKVPHFAIMGRPNVGKSTLANVLLGETRMVVFDEPGTTRDSVNVPFQFEERDYMLVDTAGLRRRSRIVAPLEQFSAVKALRTLDRVHVVVLVLDAQQGVVEQDARLTGLVWSSGRSVVLVVNKWDHLDTEQRRRVRIDVERKLAFLDDIEPLFVSAKYGGGVGAVMPAVRVAYESALADLPTAQLNIVLHEATTSVPPPMVGNRRIKLKYAHQGGKNPPLVVIHGNLTGKVPDSYLRYMSKRIRRHFKLVGTPVKITLRGNKNPYHS